MERREKKGEAHERASPGFGVEKRPLAMG